MRNDRCATLYVHVHVHVHVHVQSRLARLNGPHLLLPCVVENHLVNGTARYPNVST